MLKEDGRFRVPASAQDLIEEAKAVASPIDSFVQEECILDESANVTVEVIWERWRQWAERNGQNPGTRQLFGRNLRAATGFKVQRYQPRDGDARYRGYRGIDVRDHAGEF